MATFNTLAETTDSNTDDYFIVRQSGIDYKTKRETFQSDLLEKGLTLCVDSGSANNYILTSGLDITLSGDQIFAFVPSATSTGASTITLDSNSSLDFTTIDGSDISTEIIADQMVIVYYDAVNTRFKLLSSQSEDTDLTRGATIGQAITPTAASYSTTTVTLTVASHNILASDTIYVTDITSTVSADEGYVNGEFTVDSVTPTTIVYTATGTPTGTLTATSANISIGDLVVNGGLDLNQSFVDLSSDRSEDITYTNETGKPIVVMVQGSATDSGGGQIRIFVDGTAVWRLIASGVAWYPMAIAVVPPRSTYQITESDGIDVWYELTTG